MNELDHFRGAPLSPHIRWAEVAGRTVVGLLQLKQRAKLLGVPESEEHLHGKLVEL